MTATRAAGRLAANVRVDVRYSDGSPCGGAVSAKLQATMKRLCLPIYRALERRGAQFVVNNGADLLRQCFAGPAFEALCGTSYPKLPDAVLFPKVRSIVPEAIVLTTTDTGEAIEIPVNGSAWNAWGDWLSSETGTRSRHVRPYLGDLDAGGFTRRTAKPGASDGRRADATFVGHNSVVVRSAHRCVVVDPWFFPRAKRYGPEYQPIQREDLDRVDAALITHSHPDHFDPGSLLTIGRNTPIVVPRVARESILALDMKSRLEELGFTAVRVLDWWKTLSFGDIEVTALPFYGEQPTEGKRLYPHVRNCGNCYLLRTPRMSCGFVADSGSDMDGSVKDVALEAYERYGAIDVLFSGYRGWSLYPVQFFESSVRQYLLFVPPQLYPVRQTIMATVEGAIDTAEAWHARYLVPYGDGGAPWYAEIGLGTDAVGASTSGKPWTYFDPSLEVCEKALQNRSEPLPGIVVGSPVRPLILKPGESFNVTRRNGPIKRASPPRASRGVS